MVILIILDILKIQITTSFFTIFTTITGSNKLTKLPIIFPKAMMGPAKFGARSIWLICNSKQMLNVNWFLVHKIVTFRSQLSLIYSSSDGRPSMSCSQWHLASGRPLAICCLIALKKLSFMLQTRKTTWTRWLTWFFSSMIMEFIFLV